MRADDVSDPVRKAYTRVGPAVTAIGLLSGVVQVVQAVWAGQISVLFTSIACVCGLLVVGACIDVLRRRSQARRPDEGRPAPDRAGAARPPDRFRQIVVGCVVLSTLSLTATAASVLYAATTRPSATVASASPAGTTPATVSAAPVTVTSAAPPAACEEAAAPPALVTPDVTPVGVRSGLTFCPVLINGGQLPITGKFALAGQVLGPVEQRQQVLIVTYGDPQSCDANGAPPVPGTFFKDAAVGSPTGDWSLTDSLGYDEAVTIERHYEYVTASPDSVATIRNDRLNWLTAHPGKQNDYPGISPLPSDTRVLATFVVPAGRYPGAKPCPTG